MTAVRPRFEIPWLPDLYNCGRYKLDELISGHSTFDHLNDVLASMDQGEAIRNGIMF